MVAMQQGNQQKEFNFAVVGKNPVESVQLTVWGKRGGGSGECGAVARGVDGFKGGGPTEKKRLRSLRQFNQLMNRRRPVTRETGGNEMAEELNGDRG